MNDDTQQPATGSDAPQLPLGVGLQLRAAREKRGLTLQQVAAETRISLRHLEVIEAGDFEKMPSRTYAVGFAKSFAKVVGLDQTDVADMVRAEMQLEPLAATVRSNFDPGDPARAPSRRLVWFSLFAVVLLLIGLFFAARVLFDPAAEMTSLVEQEEAEEAARQVELAAAGEPESEAAAPAGPVVFTALGTVWVRFYDGENRVLQEGEMAEGETFTVPPTAENPQLISGRPDLLAITIGGIEVPRLADEPITVTDEPISAAALLARGQTSVAAPEAAGDTRDSTAASPSRAVQTQSAARAPVATNTQRPASRATSRPSPSPAPTRSVAPPAREFVSDPVVQGGLQSDSSVGGQTAGD